MSVDFQATARLLSSLRVGGAMGMRDSFGLTADDLARISRLAPRMTPHLGEILERFYAWLRTEPEFPHFFRDEAKVEAVKRQQIGYWASFFRGQIDQAYLEERRMVGDVHARRGLPLPVYFAAVSRFLDLLHEYAGEAATREDRRAINRLVMFDTALVVDTYSTLSSKIIAEQNEALLSMSTPVTAIWQGILLLPIVGVIDSKRSSDIMRAALEKISTTQARVFILDISGVAVVDTAVANHLIKVTKATRLMGCESVISGVSPAIAETVIELGIDVGAVATTANLQDALRLAFQRTGVDLGA